MNTKIEVFVGDPVLEDSEFAFLDQLCRDLLSAGQSGVIFANFIPPTKLDPQIDFLVILRDIVCHVELKAVSAPVFGAGNGCWELQLPDGTRKPLQNTNPYRQSLRCKQAISDEMRKFAKADKAAKPFFKQMESVLCLYPQLASGSQVISDFKVHTLGYPDLLKLLTNEKRSPGWTRQRWIEFAMHLGLTRHNQRSEEETAIEDARLNIDAYRARFTEFHEKTGAQLVWTTIEEGDVCGKSDSLNALDAAGHHVQLLGPSGIGKSIHLRRIAVDAAAEGRLTIIAPASDYRGRLSDLLNRSVAHLCPLHAIDLVEMTRRLGTSTVIAIDGFNECRADLQERLVQDLLALYLRYEIPIVITSQTQVSLPTELQGRVVRFCDLHDNERKELLEEYMAQAVSDDIVRLCKPFKSSYELSIAANCLTELGTSPTRSDLFEAYVGRLCDGAVDILLARALLAAIADEMLRNYSSSLNVHRVWTIAEQVLAAERAPLTTMEKLTNCGIIRANQGQCVFTHELLQRFFEAEAIMASSGSVTSLAETLRHPTNFHLFEFAIDRQTNPADVRTCLEQAPAEVSTDLLGRCLAGEFGQIASCVVQEDIEELFRAAEAELAQVDIEIEQPDGKNGRLVARVQNARSWTQYEHSLMQAIAKNLSSGRYLSDLIRLITKTYLGFQESLRRRYTKEALAHPAVRMVVFSELFVLGNSIVSARLLRSTHSSILDAVDEKGIELLDSIISNENDPTPAELYIALMFMPRDVTRFESSLPAFFRRCWQPNIYHLRLEALYQVVHWCNIREPFRSELVEYLSELQPDHPFLSTSLIEALMAFDVVSAGTEPDAIRRQLQLAIQNPKDEEAQQLAYGIVTSIFNEIDGHCYSEALSTFAEPDQTLLYTMATRAAPPYSLDGSWLLSRLLEKNDERTLIAFERYTRSLDAEAMGSQERTACFLIAHTGSAKYRKIPFQLDDLSNADRRAWQLYGEILFWLNRSDVSSAAVEHECRNRWQQLHTEYPFEGIDPLREFAHASSAMFGPDKESIVARLFTRFSSDVRRLLEFGLKNAARLSKLDKRVTGDRAERELLTFIIHTLGQLGNEETIAQLKTYVDDEFHGRDAVNAIRRIKANDPIEGLSVLHRW